MNLVIYYVKHVTSNIYFLLIFSQKVLRHVKLVIQKMIFSYPERLVNVIQRKNTQIFQDLLLNVYNVIIGV